jgi:hypothetical protein
MSKYAVEFECLHAKSCGGDRKCTCPLSAGYVNPAWSGGGYLVYPPGIFIVPAHETVAVSLNFALSPPEGAVLRFVDYSEDHIRQDQCLPLCRITVDSWVADRSDRNMCTLNLKNQTENDVIIDNRWSEKQYYVELQMMDNEILPFIPYFHQLCDKCDHPLVCTGRREHVCLNCKVRDAEGKTDRATVHTGPPDVSCVPSDAATSNTAVATDPVATGNTGVIDAQSVSSDSATSGWLHSCVVQ